MNDLDGVDITLLIPPGRKGEARELTKYVKDWDEVQVSHMLACRLPRSVKDGRGKLIASRPAIYGTGRE